MITACVVANAIIKDAKQGSLHTHFKCLELFETVSFSEAPSAGDKPQETFLRPGHMKKIEMSRLGVGRGASKSLELYIYRAYPVQQKSTRKMATSLRMGTHRAGS